MFLKSGHRVLLGRVECGHHSLGPDLDLNTKMMKMIGGPGVSDLVTVQELEEGEESRRLDVRDGDLVLLSRQSGVEHRVKHG